jgi:hypothetical protein
MRHSLVIPTTVSRSHDAAACSAHRLPNRGGSSVGQSSGLIIRRSQVQVLPAPPIYLRFRGGASRRWDESGTNELTTLSKIGLVVSPQG